MDSKEKRGTKVIRCRPACKLKLGLTIYTLTLIIISNVLTMIKLMKEIRIPSKTKRLNILEMFENLI